MRHHLELQPGNILARVGGVGCGEPLAHHRAVVARVEGLVPGGAVRPIAVERSEVVGDLDIALDVVGVENSQGGFGAQEMSRRVGAQHVDLIAVGPGEAQQGRVIRVGGHRDASGHIGDRKVS